MPDLTPLLNEGLYNPNDPYHHEYDNKPLRAILAMIVAVNDAIENNVVKLRDAAGTAGTVANRLAQSINQDGSLITDAVDTSMHSIESHTDTDDYVRMTVAERDKLQLIDDEATNITVKFTEPAVEFANGAVEFEDSDSVSWEFSSGTVKANLAFPTTAAHRHFYEYTPTHVTPSLPDYQSYKSTSVATVYIDGSLRVFINGMRIFEGDAIYVPGALVNDNWKLLSFTSQADDGTFSLSAPLDIADVIKIDFDIALT